MSNYAERDALPAYVRGLLEPSAYPAPPDEVRLVQTHISYVFLAGDVVYKTKKPVDFGFIEQLTVETRHRFCDAEVQLNRRLAPDVYLGVVPVLRLADGRFVVEPTEDFLQKAAKAMSLLREEVPACCQHHVRRFFWDDGTSAEPGP